MLSETLQDVHTDIGSAVDTVEGIKAELEEWLTDAGKINSKREAVCDQAIEDAKELNSQSQLSIVKEGLEQIS